MPLEITYSEDDDHHGFDVPCLVRVLFLFFFSVFHTE